MALFDFEPIAGSGVSNVLSCNGIEKFDRSTGTHTYSVVVTGEPTAVSITIQGSLDLIHWADVSSQSFDVDDLSAGFKMFHIANTPVISVRALIETTGGTDPLTSIKGLIL